MHKLPDYVEHFMQVFQKNGYEIYLVGGGVRDLLLGKLTKNWDFTTSAKPEEIMKLFPDSFYNNQFGTVGIPMEVTSYKLQVTNNNELDDQPDHEQLIFEVTTYRKESGYTDSRHPDNIEWSDKVEEDLARRDFTINAIAYDGKTLIDPYGGQKDLQEKWIRAVGDPDKRFSEDALRLMRAIRFTSQLGFLVEDKTREAIIRNAQLIQNISWERIRDELFKILASDHAAEGILFLRNTGLLQYILPEVEVCFTVDQKSPKRHHIYDVGTHLVMALKHCPSPDVVTRLATLLHDIGKAKTYRKDPESGVITFYNHEVVGAKQVEKIADRLRLSNKEKEKLVRLVRLHQFTVSEIQTDKAVRRFIREVGKEYIQDMLDLRTGDRLGSGARETSWRLELFKKRIEEVQQEPFAIKDLKIDGHDVMKILDIKPGPQIGKLLQELFNEVEEKKLPNEREMLLKRVEEIAKNSQ
jgi:tRNA nucleotidyltransferase (CCA-adding enzyme)